MAKKPEEISGEKTPERPLECGECKKNIAVYYTEVTANSKTTICMCADCPELQRRLHGIPAEEQPGMLGESTGLACGNCGTTLNAVKMGAPLGCSDCYDVFDEVLLAELFAAKKIPPRLASAKKTIPIHIGRSPGETQEMNPSLKLLALNEALNETLKREDYEQAAWLRDQIKALTENPEENDEGK
jgi:protein arginine kinase activator